MPRLARLDAPGVLHHIKGDERSLGDSDFVTSILAEAKEELDRYYEMKSRGYTLETVEKRIMEIFGVDRDLIYSKRRGKIQAAARSLLCYWVVCELGLTATELAKRLGLTQPAVSYAVSRGEQIAKEWNYTLVKQFIILCPLTRDVNHSQGKKGDFAL